MTLANKVILIIGGTSGIGLATALRAAEAGATPIVAGRSRERFAAPLAKLPQGAQARSWISPMRQAWHPLRAGSAPSITLCFQPQARLPGAPSPK